MQIVICVLAIIIAVLFGAVGVLAGIIRSEQNKANKQFAEQYKQQLDAEQQAHSIVVEVKKENEEKKQNIHSGSNLSNANALLNVLHDDKTDK